VVEPEVAHDIDNGGHNVSLVRLLQQVDHEHTDTDSEGITVSGCDTTPNLEWQKALLLDKLATLDRTLQSTKDTRAERKERLDMVVGLNAVRPSGGSMVQRLRMLQSECDSEIAEIEQGIVETGQALEQIHKKISLASNGLDNHDMHGGQTPGSVHGHRAQGGEVLGETAPRATGCERGEVLGEQAPGATDHKGGAVLDEQAPQATANNRNVGPSTWTNESNTDNLLTAGVADGTNDKSVNSTGVATEPNDESVDNIASIGKALSRTLVGVPGENAPGIVTKDHGATLGEGYTAPCSMVDAVPSASAAESHPIDGLSATGVDSSIDDKCIRHDNPPGLEDNKSVEPAAGGPEETAVNGGDTEEEPAGGPEETAANGGDTEDPESIGTTAVPEETAKNGGDTEPIGTTGRSAGRGRQEWQCGRQEWWRD
jgi:hypothetical protein